MRNKRKSIRVGDVIETTAHFTPRNKSGKAIIPEGSYRGMVIHVYETKKDTEYGVRFSKSLEFTNNLNGILSTESGYKLERDDFDIDHTV